MKQQMKQVLWLLVCVCMLAMGMTVLAETDDTTTTTLTDSTETTVSTEPSETTDPTATTVTTATETTTTETDPTGTEPIVPVLQTTITLSMPNSNTVLAQVRDSNGDPVVGVSLEFLVDGNRYINNITDQNGQVRLPVAVTPSVVVCQMADYQNGTQTYAGSETSISFSPISTLPPTAAPTTTSATVPTTVTTVPPTSSNRTTGSEPMFTTTSVPETTTTAANEGDTTTTQPEEGVTQKVSVFPKTLAIGLMSVGGLLLVAAIVLVILFIVRRPSDEDADGEELPTDETEVAAPAATDATADETVNIADETADVAETAEDDADGTMTETPPKSISLNDLFNNPRNDG